MRTVKVSYSNGDTITTGINGTDEEIRQYFAVGRAFNMGVDDDLMARVTDVEFLQEVGA